MINESCVPTQDGYLPNIYDNISVNDGLYQDKEESRSMQPTSGNGQLACLENPNSELLASPAGGSDGQLLCYDLRAAGRSPAATLWQHARGITSLSFEDPWLACGSASGAVSLMDVEACMRGASGRPPANKEGNRPPARGGNRPPACQGAHRRQLQGPGGAVSALDMAAGWLVAGGQANSARTWEFSDGGGASDGGHRGEGWRGDELCLAEGSEDEPEGHFVPSEALPTFSALRRAQYGAESLPGVPVYGAAARMQQGRGGVPLVPPPSAAPLGCRRQAASEHQTSWQIVRPRPPLLDKSRS